MNTQPSISLFPRVPGTLVAQFMVAIPLAVYALHGAFIGRIFNLYIENSACILVLIFVSLVTGYIDAGWKNKAQLVIKKKTGQSVSLDKIKISIFWLPADGGGCSLARSSSNSVIVTVRKRDVVVATWESADEHAAP